MDQRGIIKVKTAPELTDGVIILRLMTLTDAEVHLANEDEVTVRFLSGGRSTIETVSAWIERNRLSWESGGPERCFGIREAATGELVGMVEANLAAPGYHPGVVANISYGVYPASRRRGYAARAVGLMVRYLAEKTTADVAVIQYDPPNHASARVVQKAGFKHLGERTGADGTRMIVYGLRLRPGKSSLVISDVCVKDYKSI